MTTRIDSYRDLLAWQRAFELGLLVYRASDAFPDRERFGLTSQMRRSAVSIASNIAEGYSRGSRIDYLRFLKIARGSICELETQCLFASELGFLVQGSSQRVFELLEECKRLLAGFIRSLERSDR
jgi:four helix bundle protein